MQICTREKVSMSIGTTFFEADYMQVHTLEQPMANNECGFYLM